MIKVLQVVPSMGFRGVEAVVMNYYRYIDKTDLRIDFATCSIIDSLKEEVENNGSKIFYMANKNAHPLKRFNDIKRILKENKYDIVHVHSDSASLFLDLFAAKIAGTKNRIAHSHNTNCLVKWQHYLLRPLLPFVTTHRFACSEKAGEWMFGKKEFDVIVNGIDFNKYIYNIGERKNIRKELNIEDNYVVGNVSNHQPSKNQKFLCQILPELIKAIPNIKIVFVGSFSKEAETIVKENNLDEYVLCLGIRKDVPELLQAFDLFGFPSLFEGNPSAVTEASASGLPCIVSSQTYEAMSDMSFNKHLYSLDLLESLWIEKIIEIKNENNAREKMTNQQISETGFDIRVLAKQLKDKYESIATNKQ